MKPSKDYPQGGDSYEQDSCPEDGAASRKRRVLRTETAAICLPAWLQTAANGDVLVGRKSEGGDSPSPAVLSCLQRQMQADTALDAAAIRYLHSENCRKAGFGNLYTKTTSWLLSTSHRDCCLCQARIHAQPSVYSIMRKKYPAATGPLIVHRLDMATSGLMIIAKTEFAYHRLQKEFLQPSGSEEIHRHH